MKVPDQNLQKPQRQLLKSWFCSSMGHRSSFALVYLRICSIRSHFEKQETSKTWQLTSTNQTEQEIPAGSRTLDTCNYREGLGKRPGMKRKPKLGCKPSLSVRRTQQSDGRGSGGEPEHRTNLQNLKHSTRWCNRPDPC